jgi:thiosulfate dehydrogenase
MRFFHSSWCPLLLGIIFLGLLLNSLTSFHGQVAMVQGFDDRYRENEEWVAPPESSIPSDTFGDLVRYGKELIRNTAYYLGPNGEVASISNGMNCQNCHIDAGRQNFGNPFSAVTHHYPKYRDRSGRIETVEFRVNECMQRSLNGSKLDSQGVEMRAMVAYINWVGKDVPSSYYPKGMGTEKLPFLNRAADTVRGRAVYTQLCVRCHGKNGEGVLADDGKGYTYPPLWGSHSFNVSAGIYRLSTLAGFIKNNMPFGVSWKDTQLTNEQAWDVAAFVASQPRPERFFNYDWKNISRKPADYPFGPFADDFPASRHKYGPFISIVK